MSDSCTMRKAVISTPDEQHSGGILWLNSTCVSLVCVTPKEPQEGRWETQVIQHRRPQIKRQIPHPLQKLANEFLSFIKV